MIFLLLLISVCLASGQETVDKVPEYKHIKKVIKNKKSGFYYPEIYDRYLHSDTNLTLEEYRMLYYGYLFQDAYSAYPHSDYADSVNQVLDKDTLLPADYRKVIDFENIILRDQPFNLRNLNTLANCHYRLGDTLSTILTDFKLQRIVETIVSTGDGKTEKTAWHVISVGHEYDLLGYFGFHFAGSQSLTSGGCDYLTVEENEYGIEGFYFDVNKILEKESELFDK